MKIAATYDVSKTEIFHHFGKTQNFNIYTIENGMVEKSEVIDNGGFGHHDLATYLKSLGVEILILGNRGQGAIDALDAAGIKQLAGITGNPDDAIVAYLAGTLKDNPEAKCDHHGEHHEHIEDNGDKEKIVFKPL